MKKLILFILILLAGCVVIQVQDKNYDIKARKNLKQDSLKIEYHGKDKEIIDSQG